MTTSIKYHRANLIGICTLSLRGCLFDNSNSDKSDCEVVIYFPTYLEALKSWVMQIYFMAHEKDLANGEFRTMVWRDKTFYKANVLPLS